MRKRSELSLRSQNVYRVMVDTAQYVQFGAGNRQRHAAVLRQNDSMSRFALGRIPAAVPPSAPPAERMASSKDTVLVIKREAITLQRISAEFISAICCSLCGLRLGRVRL
jgi:hypothetical protein